MESAATFSSSHGILLYITCIAVSATIYRYRHLLGMIIIILFGASWIFAAAMALNALQGNVTLREQIQSAVVGVLKAYGVPNFADAYTNFATNSEHNNL